METAHSFFIEDGENILFLSSVDSISRTRTGSVTSYPIDADTDVSNYYRNAGINIRVTGVLSQFSDSRDIKEVIDSLTEIKEKGKPIIVSWSRGMPRERDCIITSLDLSPKHEYPRQSNGVISSYSVAIEFKQVEFGTGGSLESISDDFLSDIVEPSTFFGNGVKLTSSGLEIDVPDSANSTIQISLSGRTYTMGFKFNSYGDWYLTLLDDKNNVLLGGRRIKAGRGLFNAVSISDNFDGDLITIQRPTNAEPLARDNFGIGKDYGLIYIAPEDEL